MVPLTRLIRIRNKGKGPKKQLPPEKKYSGSEDVVEQQNKFNFNALISTFTVFKDYLVKRRKGIVI